VEGDYEPGALRWQGDSVVDETIMAATRRAGLFGAEPAWPRQRRAWSAGHPDKCASWGFGS